MGFLVSGAFPTFGAWGVCGPWSHAGNLFCVALSFQESVSSEGSTIGIFKSTDGGENWSQVGTEKNTPDGDTSGWPSGQSGLGTFGSCLGNDGKVYIAYVGTDVHVYVSSIDLAAEDWDTDSAQGPDFTYEGDGSFNPWIAIEQSSEGEFILLCNPSLSGDFEDKVYTTTLDETLSSWGTLDLLATQTVGEIYWVIGIAKGSAGRVHGFLANDFTAEIFHCLLRDTGGGGVGTLELIDSGKKLGGTAPGCPAALALPGDEVMVAYAGAGDSVESAYGASASIPSFTNAQIEGAQANQFTSLALWGATSAMFHLPGGTDILRRDFAGGAWGGSAVLEAVTGLLINGRTGGLFYSLDGTDLYFIPLADEAEGCGVDPRLPPCDTPATDQCSDVQGVSF